MSLSLGLDPDITVESCGSAQEALARAADTLPDVILCDVVMPGTDGPALLAHLAENASTADIAVIFMTARRQPREIERLKSIGAAGVIVKPFKIETLAASVRRHLRFIKLGGLRADFIQRLRRDLARFTQLRQVLREDARCPATLENLHLCAHQLAGTAGIFEFLDVSDAASAVEESVGARRRSDPAAGHVENDLNALIECIEAECAIGDGVIEAGQPR